MKEKLIIKNFGPIRHVELELGRFNVLIGDQGTGKSTIAKSLISIQSTVLREIWSIEFAQRNTNTKVESFKEYLKISGILTYIATDSYFFYESDFMTFSYENDFVEQTLKSNKNGNSTLRYDINYIPAERNFVINFGGNLYALIETGTHLPGLFTRFGDKFLKAKESLLLFDYTEIIGIKYSYRDSDFDKIILSNGKEILLANSSSGIQTSIPLLVVFDKIIRNRFPTKNDFKPLIVIEEPELNCFPQTQYRLVKYFISNLQFEKNEERIFKNQTIITTHSPYILTSLNNLLYSYKVGNNNNPEEINKIIEKKYWLNPDEVSAYRLMEDGTAKDILDKELSIIDPAELDEVSRTINETWDKIADVEYSKTERIDEF